MSCVQTHTPSTPTPWQSGLLLWFWVSGLSWALSSCVFLCVSVSLSPSICVCVSPTCPLPPAPSFTRAVEQPCRAVSPPPGSGASERPGSQILARVFLKELGFGWRHSGRVRLRERLGLAFEIGFCSRSFGRFGSPESWQWARGWSGKTFPDLSHPPFWGADSTHTHTGQDQLPPSPPLNPARPPVRAVLACGHYCGLGLGS